jgi:hypothetical protein
MESSRTRAESELSSELSTVLTNNEPGRDPSPPIHKIVRGMEMVRQNVSRSFDPSLINGDMRSRLKKWQEDQKLEGAESPEKQMGSPNKKAKVSHTKENALILSTIEALAKVRSRLEAMMIQGLGEIRFREIVISTNQRRPYTTRWPIARYKWTKSSNMYTRHQAKASHSTARMRRCIYTVQQMQAFSLNSLGQKEPHPGRELWWY